MYSSEIFCFSSANYIFNKKLLGNVTFVCESLSLWFHQLQSKFDTITQNVSRMLKIRQVINDLLQKNLQILAEYF
jgi:hypothetical protein